MVTKYKKFVATAATATLVASAIVPVASANESTFTDIGGYAQETQDKINSLAERGIVNGTSATTFNPTAPIKRSQVVKLLGRYLVEEQGKEIPADWATVKRFTDVDLAKDTELSKYAAVVYDAGVFTGNNGALEGSKEISRQNMAVVLDRAAEAIAGITFVEAAEGLDHGVTDLATAKTAAREAIAALNALEISTASQFKPLNNVSRANFATFLYNAIDVIAELTEETTSLEKAIDALPKEVTADTLVAAKALVATAQVELDAAVKAETVTATEAAAFQAKIDEVVAQIEAVEEAAKKLFVKSVAPLNATQVLVTFNKEVDKATAETHGNYTFASLDGVTTTATAATLSADGKSVVVTVDNPTSKRYQVKVANVQAKDKATEIASFDQILTFAADTKAPSITGTERVSASKVKVKFSEPVSGGTISAKYADGTAITGFPALTLSKTDELLVDLSAADIVVGKDIVITFNGVVDTNNNLITPQPASVTVKKEAVDGVTPALGGITQTGAKEFTVNFTKGLDGFAFTADGTEIAVTNNTVTAIEKVTATQYKVTVANLLDGLQTVTVKAGKAQDIDGQANTADLTKLVTFKKDIAAPKATAKLVVGQDNKEYVELTFDKDVTVGAVTVNGSYVKDYVTTAVTNVTATAQYADATNKKVVLVPLTDAALSVEGATYNLKLTSAAVKSDAEVAMTETAVTFTRGQDGEAAVTENTEVVSGVTVTQGSTPDTVLATFTVPAGHKLDGASAINKANYSIPGAEIESISLAAVSGTTQVATLHLKSNSNTFTGVRNITVKDVKIANSTKVMEPVLINNQELVENVRPTVVSAAITANNKVTVTFSEAVTVEQVDAFLVKAGTETVAQAAAGAVVSGTDAKKVEITLASDFTTAQLAETITVEPAKTANGDVDTAKFKVKDAKGNYVEVFAPVTVQKP